MSGQKSGQWPQRRARRAGLRPLSAALIGLSALTLAGCATPRWVRDAVDIILPPSGDIFSPSTRSVSASGAEILEAKAETGRFRGLVVADEPRAAEVARAVLAAGGNAADAATALYFTLAATYPSAASLGGGGQCLIRPATATEVILVSFPGKAAGAGFAPGAVRGFGLINARFGVLQWSQLVAPAEVIARSGFSATRATARSLAALAPLIAADATARAAFGRADGTPRGEGERIEQPDLADTLEILRTKGPGAFNAGPLAEAISGAPGGADGATLVATTPAIGAAPGQAGGAGAIFEGAALGAGGVEDLSATAFAILGRYGDAAACVLSQGKAGGAGRMAPGLGFVIGVPNRAALVPVIVAGERTSFVGAAAGKTAALALAGAVDAARNGGSIGAALAANRASGVEPAHALSCPAGIPGGGGACYGEADPKGAGVALVAQRFR